MLPSTNWKYENWLLPTLPGTEINVTPESAVPIMLYATRYQGEFLPAVKNVLVSAPRLVMYEIVSRTAK
jgi:hypothetical protein